MGASHRRHDISDWRLESLEAVASGQKGIVVRPRLRQVYPH